MAAWGKSLEAYRDFRQGSRGDPHPKVLSNGRTAKVPGRSFWPEPDSLRGITGCALRPDGKAGVPAAHPAIDTHDHSTPIVPASTLPGFPRALLGLPIIFHFVDGSSAGSAPRRSRDPAAGMLVPSVVDADGRTGPGNRMASPVITRPLSMQGQWYPSVLILRALHLRSLESYLIVNGVDSQGMTEAKDRLVPSSQIVNPAFAAVRPMLGKDNALDALEAYMKTKGFRTL